MRTAQGAFNRRGFNKVAHTGLVARYATLALLALAAALTALVILS